MGGTRPMVKWLLFTMQDYVAVCMRNPKKRTEGRMLQTWRGKGAR